MVDSMRRAFSSTCLDTHTHTHTHTHTYTCQSQSALTHRDADVYLERVRQVHIAVKAGELQGRQRPAGERDAWDAQDEQETFNIGLRAQAHTTAG